MSGQMKLVPVVPSEAQWGGLARAIMIWLDMGDGRPTPRDLFAHLKSTGEDVPDWLRDEPELQHLDHVPSKGTRCAIIYRAMIEASPTPVDEVGSLGEGLRERAACAAIADNMKIDPENGEYEEGFFDACLQIGTAIRARTLASDLATQGQK